MAYPTISELPDPPQRGEEQEDFVSKANAFTAALPTFRSQVNEAGTFIETAAQESGEARDAAQGFAEDAEAARQAALEALPIYTSVANGLAGTADGEFFRVIDGDAVLIYLNDGGTAVQQALNSPSSRVVGTGADEVPDNSALPGSVSVGALADHQDPALKELLVRLDHLEQALGIDPTGPAGADVLAAVGRGAIVDVIENSDGTSIRSESGLQILQSELSIDVATSTPQVFDFPADMVGDRGDVFAFMGHLTGGPSGALRLNENVRAIGNAGNRWVITLATAGTSSDPSSDNEKMAATAIGFWK